MYLGRATAIAPTTIRVDQLGDHPEGENMRRNTRTTTALLTAFAALAAPSGAAAAGDDNSLLSTFGSAPSPTLNCPDPLIEQPFAAYGDPRDFVLAPGGAFSHTGGGWSLRGDADIDDGMLKLPEDGSATSPAMCVDLDYPVARFRYDVRGRDDDDAEIRVEVRYPDGADDDWQRVAQFDGDEGQYIGGGWRLSRDVPMRPELGGNQPGWRHVQIRLRSKDERFRIDDVYVDPKRRS